MQSMIIYTELKKKKQMEKNKPKALVSFFPEKFIYK